MHHCDKLVALNYCFLVVLLILVLFTFTFPFRYSLDSWPVLVRILLMASLCSGATQVDL